MTPSALVDAATRLQVFLERYKTGQLRDLRGVLVESEKAIIAVLQKLQDNRLSDMSRKRFNALLVELATVERDILAGHAVAFTNNLENLHGTVMQFEEHALGSVIRGAEIVQPKASVAFARALKAPMSATGDLLKTFVDSLSTNSVRKTNQLLQKAYLEGYTIQETVQGIRGTRARQFKDGTTALKTRQAEAIARTSIQQVASDARFQLWEENDDIVTGYEWVSTLDGVTSTICRSLDGRKWKVGEGPRPPAHINCRSTTVAVLNDGLDFLDKGATRSSSTGQVAAGEDYYQWLKKQPRSFVADTIGPQRTKLLLDGGLTATEFRDMQIDKYFNPMTLEEMKKSHAKAFERAGIN